MTNFSTAPWPAREYNPEPRDQRHAGAHRGNIGHSRWQKNCRKSQSRQRNIDNKNSGHDLKDAEATIGGALIKMRPVRLPYRFAVHSPADERDGAVGKIIKRQQDPRGAAATAGKHEQQPAKQKTDRQTTDVAEKKLRHRPIEKSKAD